MKIPADKRDVLIIALGFFLLWWWTKNWWLLCVSGIVLLAGWIHPLSRSWLLKIWYGLAKVLGAIMSRVVLTLVYFLVLCPIAFFQRLFAHKKYNVSRNKLDSSLIHTAEEFNAAYFDRPW